MIKEVENKEQRVAFRIDRLVCKLNHISKIVCNDLTIPS